MAGDWIKMRNNLRDDPAVIAIAGRLGCSEDLVVGKLHRLWSWADQHTKDGLAVGLTAAWVDGYVSLPGFSEAMKTVSWLIVRTDGIEVPKFGVHNGVTAKTRADAMIRKRASRNGVTKSCDKSVTREEKRREEKNKKSSASADDSTAAILIFKTEGSPATWNLTQKLVDDWAKLYPSIDILAECKRALGWIDADSERLKTARGMKRFLVRWFNRSVDRKGGKPNERQLPDRLQTPEERASWRP